MTILTATPTQSRVFDEEVAARRDDAGVDYSGWFCVETEPWPCPAAGCEIAQPYLTAAHLIVVWPRKDDPDMLEVAFDAQRLGRNPSVREYEQGFGPCIAYDVWVRIGRPVHGLAPRPENVPFREL